MSGADATFTIRRAEPEDHRSIVRVLDAWWGGRHMADMLPRLFFVHFGSTSFVAEGRGSVIGFVTGFRSQAYPGQAYVHFVGVDPAWRKAGVARALYQRFFQAAGALGCEEVHCVTSPVNRGSIAFHAAMGFEALPGDAHIAGSPCVVDYDGPGEPRVRLRKRLARFEP